MKALASFRNTLLTLPDPMERMLVMVFGSLAWTSRGHATDKAIILGLAGHSPESISPEDVEDLVAANDSGDGLAISGGRKISFAAERENAAEIAMDQPLRLTCDPVAGLVQIPCMERNAFGAVKAQMLHTLPFSETGCTQSHSIK